jgi:hypothetical protein
MMIERPTIVFFFGSHETSPIIIRQAHTGVTVLIKSREMTGRTETLPWRMGEKG